MPEEQLEFDFAYKKDYRPSLVQMVGMVGKDLGAITVGCLKGIGRKFKGAYEVCVDIHEESDYKRGLKDFAGASIAPYYIPTLLRRVDDREKAGDYEFLDLDDRPGIMLGGCGWFLQLVAYILIAAGDKRILDIDAYPEVLLFPVATNLISGVYEYGKYIKRRLTKKHEESLDAKLDDD